MKIAQGIFGLLFKSYVALVFVVTLLFFYVPIFVLLQFPSQKKKVFRIHVWWSWSVRILMGIFVRYELKSPLPEAPYIVVANHSSYLDIFIMYSILPEHPFLFLGKSEILAYPLVKTLFKKLNIPVHRKDKRKAALSFIQCKKAIQEGWSLIIFPEGTIPDENLPNMIPFKEGAFKLAQSAGIPLVPITFTTHYKLFSDPEKLMGPARPGVSRIYRHPAISKETVKQLSTEELMQLTYQIIDAPFRK